MCGINGIVQLYGVNANPETARANLRAMNQAIAHRGPDGEGEYLDGGVALGHRRLSILDLSENGAQPMFNQDRTKVLVFNGEIYNYIELMAELKQRGHTFRSHSDSEVLLRAYEEWGPQCVERFNGMWAFAIWDNTHRTLFASRDRLGVKPFYYAQAAGRFLFSSEIKGIGATLPLNDANLGKVYEYLAYGYRTNDGETFFAGVSELPPGHNLFIERAALRLARYWQLPEPQNVTQSTATDEQLREQFAELLKDAVRLRFRSDVPVALLQSGGLDSSAICRIVDDEIGVGNLGRESVTAYTAVFPGYKHNEAETVRELIASCHHVRLEEIAPSGTDLIKILPDFIRGMGEPLQSTTAFAHYSLMQAIHNRGIKVVINGQGADEALAGYGRYITGYRLLDILLSRPAAALHQARAMRNELGSGYSQLLGQLAKAMLGRRSASRMRSLMERTHHTLDRDFRGRYVRRLSDNPMSFTPCNLDRHLRTQLERYGFNQILHYEDQSSMLNSIEIRSPFIDYRLMEFAFRLPDRLKFDRGITKRILRETFSKRLPQRVLTQPKIGFATPFSQWMQAADFKTMVRDLIDSPSFRQRRVWQAKKLQAHFARPHVYPQFPFWRFINLEMWAQAYSIRNL